MIEYAILQQTSKETGFARLFLRRIGRKKAQKSLLNRKVEQIPARRPCVEITFLWRLKKNVGTTSLSLLEIKKPTQTV